MIAAVLTALVTGCRYIGSSTRTLGVRMSGIYVEQFYGVNGSVWWRAVDPVTRREAIAATKERALEALRMALEWGEGCEECDDQRSQIG